jgi:hypothetical protein
MVAGVWAQNLPGPSVRSAGDVARVRRAGSTADSPRSDESIAGNVGRLEEETSSSAVPLRRRRVRGRETERQRAPWRRALPSPLGRSRDKSASRRRVLRRSSSTLAIARADVRRIRQRRRVVVNPLAKTDEAAEQKKLDKLSRELESGRKTKRIDDGTVSSRCRST